MILTPIEKRAGVGREEFIENYLKPRKPLVFKDLAANWDATHKWTFEYLRQTYGHIEVPVFDNNFHKPGKGYMSPKEQMLFRDYLTLIENEPTELRMFLFNIFKYVPELAKDVSTPTIMDGFVKEYPFMFFGGEGSFTPMHYDIDCSSVFLTQFCKKKRVVLYAPDQSKYLYRHPFTVQSPVNILKPDYERFPAFKNAQGLETVLEHGETLFIPSTYWHFVHYVEGGFSISLRANDSIATKLRGLYNITRHAVVDKGLNALLGSKWKKWKETQAAERAKEAIVA